MFVFVHLAIVKHSVRIFVNALYISLLLLLLLLLGFSFRFEKGFECVLVMMVFTPPG